MSRPAYRSVFGYIGQSLLVGALASEYLRSPITHGGGFDASKWEEMMSRDDGGDMRRNLQR